MEQTNKNTVIENKHNIKEANDKNRSFSSEDDNLADNDQEVTSTYILKYTRTEEQLKELSQETGQRKAKKCLIMINLKMMNNNSNKEAEEEKKEEQKGEEAAPSENFLAICCHEIAAVYFDEIYEKVFTLDDLKKENKYFRVFDRIEQARKIIDFALKNNENNMKKIFVTFENKELKLHMKLSFFNKEKEIILSVPKKHLSDTEKINLLPEFLKEIQDKMNHLEDENRLLRDKKKRNFHSYKLDEVNIVVNNRTMSVKPRMFMFEKNEDLSTEKYISQKKMSNDTSDSTKNGNDKLSNSWKMSPAEVEKADSNSSNDNGGTVKFKIKKPRNKVKIARKMPEANFF